VKTVEISLTDVDGAEHRYQIELFSCDESVRLQLIVAQPLLKALGQIAAGVAPGLAAGEGEDVPLLQRIAAMDLSSLSEALPEIPRMLEERGGPELIQQIFKRTKRDMHAVDSDGVVHEHMAPLSAANNRDDAFADGNFLEYWQAVASVLLVNFTRHGRNGSLSSSDLLSAVTGGLIRRTKAATTTNGKGNAQQSAEG
jgi:hypothetical protein